MNIKELLLKVKPIRNFYIGKKFLNDPHYLEIQRKNNNEDSKRPLKPEVINFLLSLSEEDKIYLEIGVRNPDHHFHHIKADIKYSVDPGIEFEPNPVDFKMTSDTFFHALKKGEILSPEIKFDVIFIDGLHLAEQVNRDIENALKYIKDDGFVVLHDCNPPSEWHARELFSYKFTPAHGYWNGTTWKAFLKWRSDNSVFSCCIDSDWGIGIISKKHKIGYSIDSVNPFFEFKDFDENRKAHLNLMTFDTFKSILEK